MGTDSLRVAIHQPNFLQGSRWLNKLANCDIFVSLNTVDFDKENFQHRNKILLNGKDTWVTIPIDHKSPKCLKDIEVARTAWDERIIEQITAAYGKNPWFKEWQMRWILQTIEAGGRLRFLDDICRDMTDTLKCILGIDTPLIDASSLSYPGAKAEGVLNICKELKATEYLSGVGAREYMEPILPKFEEAGIKIIWQDFVPEHNYSIIHDIAEKGIEGTKKWLSFS
jgi:hypothetical protein